MKTIIGLIFAVFAMAITLWCCQGKNPSFNAPISPIVTPQPILSIADLMIDKITHSSNAANTPISKITKLRKYDSIFYKALFDSTGSLPNKYFYSRRGSCCPCSLGGKTCCQCSGATAFGVPEQALSQAMRRTDTKSVFMLAKMSATPPPPNTLILDSLIMDGMKIFTVPNNTPSGSYLVSFKGGSIDLSLQLDIDINHYINISDIP